MNLLVISHTCLVDVYQTVYRVLEQRGHTITIVTPANWREVTGVGVIHPARLAGFSGSIIPIRVWKPGSNPLHGYLASTTGLVARVRPDVIYIDQEPFSVSAFQWALAARRERRPAVFYSNQNIFKTYPLPFRWTERHVWSWCRAAVVVSEEVERVLRQRGYRGPIHRIPYSVDLPLFDGQARDEGLKSSLGLRPLVVAYFGRFVKEKGIEVLIDAYERLEARPSTSLLMVGGGPLEATCRQVDGSIVVTGVPHSQVPRYLGLADLLVLPSITTPRWKEQFGRVIIEALACGVPVIGSDSGEIPHLLARTQGGFVVPEGDSDALAAAMDRMLRDDGLRRTLAEQGRACVRRSYGTEARAEALEAVLVGVAADR